MNNHNTDNYEYTKISDLNPNCKKVNIFGIVKFFRPPVVTKIGQYSAFYTVIDPSIGSKVENGVRCCFFANDKKDLPQVENVGDIVRFHRVSIQFFNGRCQVKNMKATSWIVYDSRNFNENKFKSSHMNPSINNQDVKYAKELYEWMSSIEVHLPERLPIKNTSLSNISLDTYFNCLVRIMNVNKLDDESSHCLLTVSDGTKVSYNSLRQIGVKNIETGGNQSVFHSYSYDISVFDDHVADVVSLKPGDYVVLVNIHAKSVLPHILNKCKQDLALTEIEGINEWVELIIHTGKSFGRSIKKASSPECNSVIRSMENKICSIADDYRKKRRESLMSVRLTNQQVLTATGFPNQPIIAIKKLKDLPVPAKARLMVKVIAINPNSVQQCVLCQCNTCNLRLPVKNTEYTNLVLQCEICKNAFELIYCFIMLVEDDSGMLQVIVAEDDAYTFLNKVAPKKVLTDTSVLEKLQNKFNKLFGCQINCNNVEDIDIGLIPTIEMCVYSFTTKDGVAYRLFGTSLT